MSMIPSASLYLLRDQLRNIPITTPIVEEQNDLNT
jgi:hypothetical protein